MPLRSGNTSPQSSAQPGGKALRHILYAEVTMRTLSYAVHLGLPVKFRVVRAAAAGGGEDLAASGCPTRARSSVATLLSHRRRPRAPGAGRGSQ
jgi:hypothetical protein